MGIMFIIEYIKGDDTLGRKRVTILPQTQTVLRQMGDQIKTSRLRRRLPAELVAERAGVSRATVWKVENGDPSVAIGIYAAVLHALNNMDQDLLLIAKDDILGQKLRDLELNKKKRAPKKRKELGRFIPKDATVSHLTDSLTGTLKGNHDPDAAKEERLSEKYGSID